MDEITTHTINVTLPSLANLTELQKEFDALELPQAAREALLRSVVTEQTSSPVVHHPEAAEISVEFVCNPPEAVCDAPEAICDPPEAVCDPPVMDPVEPLVKSEVNVVEPVVESVPSTVIPESLLSSRTSVGCCCQ
jgi:hypothetical protein